MASRSSDPAAAGLAGRLLIAMPGIGDPRFDRAVILICAHDEDHAMGVRLDRPVEGLTVSDLLEKLDIEPAGTDGRRLVLAGGPVERERGFVLHTLDVGVEGSTLPVTEDTGLTATREILQAMASGEGPKRAAVALGYAGWGPGQLEMELRENVWLTGQPDPDLVFDDHYDTKWSRALAALGVTADQLSASAGRA